MTWPRESSRVPMPRSPDRHPLEGGGLGGGGEGIVADSLCAPFSESEQLVSRTRLPGLVVETDQPHVGDVTPLLFSDRKSVV